MLLKVPLGVQNCLKDLYQSSNEILVPPEVSVTEQLIGVFRTFRNIQITNFVQFFCIIRRALHVEAIWAENWSTMHQTWGLGTLLEPYGSHLGNDLVPGHFQNRFLMDFERFWPPSGQAVCIKIRSKNRATSTTNPSQILPEALRNEFGYMVGSGTLSGSPWSNFCPILGAILDPAGR